MSSSGGRGEIRIEEPTAVERTIARRSAEARATVPHFELSVLVELAENRRRSITGTLVHACAGALREVPRANAGYRDGRFELYSRVNIGVVIAGEDSYSIPTVFDADLKSPGELTDEIEQLAARAREGALPPPAFSGATFTVWNAGALGIDRAAMIIVPPQAAALAAGEIRKDGSMALTLACDHRILYGAPAARFLNEVRSRLARAP